jgi:hypothetical protein
MRLGEVIRAKDRKRGIMTKWLSTRLLIMTGTAVYWLYFWLFFAIHSTPVPTVHEWGTSIPLFQVFSHGFGTDGARVLSSPLVRFNFWLNLPCWLITWPLTRLGLSGSILGTNMLGGRLLLVTLLSGVQWYLISSRLQRLLNRKSRVGHP